MFVSDFYQSGIKFGTSAFSEIRGPSLARKTTATLKSPLVLANKQYAKYLYKFIYLPLT